MKNTYSVAVKQKNTCHIDHTMCTEQGTSLNPNNIYDTCVFNVFQVAIVKF